MATSWPEYFPSRLMGRRLGSSALSSFAIALEAWRRGLGVTFTAADLHLFKVSDGQRQISFNFSRPDSLTPREDYLRLDRKRETSLILGSHGVPTPLGHIIDPWKLSLSELRELADGLGYPVVLKPNVGSMGRGVFSDLKDWAELTDAYVQLTRDTQKQPVILEKHHSGHDYRLLVVGNRVVSAVQRVPAHVIGDGRSTIEGLIEAKNERRIRNPFLGSGLIRVDYEVNKCLSDQGFGLGSVPTKQHRVTLRRVANASAGGDVRDVTDSLPEKIKTAAIAAVAVLPNIHIAGVDVLFDTDAKDKDSDYVVIEINSRPQIGVNMYPSIGLGRDVPKAIIDAFFPESSRPVSAYVKTVKFNQVAIRNIFAEGLASEVSLPELPQHHYPYRQRFLYSREGRQVTLRPYSGRIIKKIARMNGIAGKLVTNKDGSLELFVASSTPDKSAVLVKRVSELCNHGNPSQSEWEGIVTVGFQIS